MKKILYILMLGISMTVLATGGEDQTEVDDERDGNVEQQICSVWNLWCLF